MSLKKMFKTAPLPFQGQKRRFAGGFATALSELKAKQEVKIVVDLFGGSGLLAHIAKHIIPEATVIYNDYDNYSQRLRNIDATNRLLADLRLITADQPKDHKINKVACSTADNDAFFALISSRMKSFTDMVKESSSLSQLSTSFNDWHLSE